MTATNTWLMEVEYEDGEVFTHRIHHDPRDEAWECVFPCAVAIRFIPLSPAPAQEIPGDSVAAPAEVEQVQGTSFDLFAHPADQETINHCPECNRFWVGLPFIAEVDQVMDGLLLSLGVTLSHDVPKFLSDEERQRRINNFFGSDSFQALAKVGNRLFEICAQENISVVDAVIDYVGGHRA